MDRAWKPNVEISPSCPRCGSSNTKFCYYNNYSLTQPRYFCKGCRRYWTKGGSLRNVPIGGGCRKNRRAKSLRMSPTDHHHVPNTHSKTLGYGGFSTCDSPTHSYKGTSSSSSTISDGSHIDLALVYANFLNPQPVSKTSSSSNFGMQELGSSDFDPSLDFTNLEPNLPAECITAMEVPLADNDHQLMYYYGMDSLLAHNKHQADDNHKIQQCTTNDHFNDTINCGLPPLPGEEVGSLWSNSDHNHIHNRNRNLNHTMQVRQEPILGPETHDPNSLLMGDWSPFDLSNDDTFSRT